MTTVTPATASDTDNSMSRFKEWRDGMNRPGAWEWEIIGALHYGKVFFLDEDPLVRRQSLSFYLWTANHFVSPKAPAFSASEVEKKARSILTTHFFKMGRDWNSWGFCADLAPATDNRLCIDLVNFLCCARVGMTQGIEWFKWNFFFIDTALNANDEKMYKEDRVISDFLSQMFWLLFMAEDVGSHRKGLQDQFAVHRDAILTEIFIRAPWQLLPFVLEEGDMALLESVQSAHPEAYPRVFKASPYRMCERIHDSPYIALPTRGEVLTVLKSRMKV